MGGGASRTDQKSGSDPLTVVALEDLTLAELHGAAEPNP